MRAIIVDDEPWMLKYFAGVCTEIPELVLVNSFRTPANALACVQAETVDLVFLDYEMPKMTGAELAALIRAEQPAVKIILVTAYEEYREEARKKNFADAYLTKPYNAEDLRQAIRNACGSAEGEERA